MVMETQNYSNVLYIRPSDSGRGSPAVSPLVSPSGAYVGIQTHSHTDGLVGHKTRQRVVIVERDL